MKITYTWEAIDIKAGVEFTHADKPYRIIQYKGRQTFAVLLEDIIVIESATGEAVADELNRLKAEPK